MTECMGIMQISDGLDNKKGSTIPMYREKV